MTDISPDLVELFNRTASRSVAAGDQLIARGRYLRGALFRDAVRSGLPAGATILDYGCGRGRISRMIAQCGFRVDARDPSSESLRDAKEQDLSGMEIEFRILTGFGEALPASAYDGIVCSSVIEFVEEPATLLGHFHRALKPGGRLFLSFSNRLSLWRAYALWRSGGKSPHFKFQKNVWSPAECRRRLEQAGLSNVRITRYFEPPNVIRPLASRLASCRFVGTLGFVTALKPLGSDRP